MSKIEGWKPGAGLNSTMSLHAFAQLMICLYSLNLLGKICCYTINPVNVSHMLQQPGGGPHPPIGGEGGPGGRHMQHHFHFAIVVSADCWVPLSSLH